MANCRSYNNMKDMLRFWGSTYRDVWSLGSNSCWRNILGSWLLKLEMKHSDYEGVYWRNSDFRRWNPTRNQKPMQDCTMMMMMMRSMRLFILSWVLSGYMDQASHKLQSSQGDSGRGQRLWSVCCNGIEGLSSWRSWFFSICGSSFWGKIWDFESLFTIVCNQNLRSWKNVVRFCNCDGSPAQLADNAKGLYLH